MKALQHLTDLEPDKWNNIPIPITEACSIFKSEISRLGGMTLRLDKSLRELIRTMKEEREKDTEESAYQFATMNQTLHSRIEEIDSAVKTALQTAHREREESMTRHHVSTKTLIADV